jgi:hypothetical protein
MSPTSVGEAKASLSSGWIFTQRTGPPIDTRLPTRGLGESAACANMIVAPSDAPITETLVEAVFVRSSAAPTAASRSVSARSSRP